MKRIWICCGILVILFLGALGNDFYLHRLSGTMVDTLLQAQDAAEEEDWDRAISLTEEVESRWHSHTKYLYIMMRHSEADDVTIGLQEVQQLLRWGEDAEYTSANARLITQIQLLAEMEELSIENLL